MERNKKIIVEINSDMRRIIKKCAAVQNIIDKKSKCCNNGHLLIYGGGRHTEVLFDVLDFSKWKSVRICDSYRMGIINEIIFEKPTKELYEWADAIVISSHSRMLEIYKSICDYVNVDKIIKLYNINEEFPFYMDEIEIEDDDKINNNAANNFDRDEYREIALSEYAPAKYDESVEKNFFGLVTKEYFLKYINSNDNVLDVGAGTGRLSGELYKVKARVTAVDISEARLNFLKELYPNIDTLVVKDEKLPFLSETFDAVVSCDVMIHFLEWKKFFVEHCRVVKKNGVIIYNMYNDDHLSYISSDKIFRSKYMTFRNNCYSTVSKAELQSICQSIGNVELLEMIPYNFFSQSAFGYGLLTRNQIHDLQIYYNILCKNKNARGVIKRFENEIVRNLPEYMTACNICVFRKK